MGVGLGCVSHAPPGAIFLLHGRLHWATCVSSGRHASTLLPVGPPSLSVHSDAFPSPTGPETLTLGNLASSSLAPPGPVSQQKGLSLTPPDGVEMLPWVGSGHSPAACLENISRSFPSASALGQSKPALPRASPWWA